MAKLLTIEVNSAEVRVAEAEQNRKGNSYIKNCFCFDTPQGAVEDGYIRDVVTLGEVLKKELDAHNIKTKRVKFITTSSKVASREARIPFVKEKQIQGLLEANVTEYFPIDITQYVISYGIVDIEEKEEEKQYHLMVYAAPKALGASYRGLAEEAELKLEGVGSSGDSLYRAVRQQYAQGTHFLIKIENKYTMIAIVRDGELALLRVLNYGIDGAVEALRTGPVFDGEAGFSDALHELRKARYISDMIDGELLHEDDALRESEKEVTESFRYLVGNISRLMDYYISRNTGTAFDSISCCGLGAGINGLTTLLSNEIGQEVQVLETLEGSSFVVNDQASMAQYVVLSGILDSRVNLMEQVVKKKSTGNEDIRGAMLVFIAGVAGAVILGGTAFGVNIYQAQHQKYLNRRIEEEKPIEEIYNMYTHMQEQYDAFEMMHGYTDTPNTGLVEFLEEMEAKMPSSLMIESFSSDGIGVTFTTSVESKDAAADLVIQLRSFESLSDVTTTGIEDIGDGVVVLTVTCTYAEPAVLSQQQE